ncbi:MAG TPA: response regulator [Opitutaceae bacterium]|nr:response regulator [Opitutaceae bacterium]
MSRLLSVLIAEDDESDVYFMMRALKKAELENPVTFVPDGLAAIEALSHAKAQPEQRLPALVLLDLKMPRRTGLQVLEWMRREPVIRSIPAVVLSSSSNQSDIEAAYEAGANGFLMKSPSSENRLEIAIFIKAWLRLMQPPLTASESFKVALAYRASSTAAEDPA